MIPPEAASKPKLPHLRLPLTIPSTLLYSVGATRGAVESDCLLLILNNLRGAAHLRRCRWYCRG